NSQEAMSASANPPCWLAVRMMATAVASAKWMPRTSLTRRRRSNGWTGGRSSVMVGQEGRKEAAKISQLSSSRNPDVYSVSLGVAVAHKLGGQDLASGYEAVCVPAPMRLRQRDPTYRDHGQDRGDGKGGDAVAPLPPQGLGGHSKVAMIALK